MTATLWENRPLTNRVLLPDVYATVAFELRFDGADTLCGAERDGYTCSRPAGHMASVHVAVAPPEMVIAAWPLPHRPTAMDLYGPDDEDAHTLLRLYMRNYFLSAIAAVLYGVVALAVGGWWRWFSGAFAAVFAVAAVYIGVKFVREFLAHLDVCSTRRSWPQRSGGEPT